MKKKYIEPRIIVVPVAPVHIIATSITAEIDDGSIQDEGTENLVNEFWFYEEEYYEDEFYTW